MMKKYVFLVCCLVSAVVVFPPMCSSGVSSPTVKMTLVKNRGGIADLDSQRNVEYSRTYEVSEVSVDYSDSMLEIPGVGKMGFKDDFFADYTTIMFVPKGELYVFKVTSDDGFRLTIDGKVVAEHPENRPMTETKGEVYLERGEHTLVLNYYQGYGPLGLETSYGRKKGSKTATIGRNSGGVKFKLPK